jgi:PhnB protein
MTKAIPEGFHSVTPSFTFKNTEKALEFYKKAFNAEPVNIFPHPNGQGIMHASLKIGNSIIMMGDEMHGSENCAKSAETIGSSPIGLFLYVSDVDSAFAQAVAAGGQAVMPVTEMFWGDRVGQVKDPFGYSWMIATHTQDLAQAEITKRAEEFFSSFAKK